MVLDHFRALIKRSSTTSSLSSDYSPSTAPSSFSTFAFEQYPFPTNPDCVKKARHGNHPKYLPQADASVRDVRHFLYTLLTSKNNHCAKKYPEWVLETCMAWSGTGEALRSCSEQQLATICPYVAVAVGIESRKHKQGAYVPIPARHIIGEVVARFVADKKKFERQFVDIQRRLDKERSRSSSAMDNFAMSHAAQGPSMAGTRTSQASPGTTKHNSQQSSSSRGRPNLSFPDPSKWLAPDEVAEVGLISSHPARPASSSGRMPGTAMSPPPRPRSASLTISSTSWDNVAPRHRHSTTSLSLSGPTGTHGSAGVENTRYQQMQTPDSTIGIQILHMRSTDIQSLPSQRQTWLGISADVRNSASRCNASGPSAGPSSRFAPRRPSTLRTSSTGNPEGSGVPTSTVPRRMKSMNTAIRKDFGFLPPTRSSTPGNRRNTMSPTIRLAIPEESADQLKAMSEDLGNSNEKLRHDSGVDDTTSASQSLSECSVASEISSKLLAQSAAPLSVASIDPSSSGHKDLPHPISAQAWSASESQDSSSVAKQMIQIGPAGNAFAGSASTPPVIIAPSSPNDISIAGLESTPATPTMPGKGGDGSIVTNDEIAAFEAQYQALLQLRAQKIPNAPNRTVRFAEHNYQQQAQHTSYNQMRSMSQENLYSVQRPSSPSARSGSLSSMTRALTLYEIIDAEQRASRS